MQRENILLSYLFFFSLLPLFAIEGLLFFILFAVAERRSNKSKHKKVQSADKNHCFKYFLFISLFAIAIVYHTE